MKLFLINPHPLQENYVRYMAARAINISREILELQMHALKKKHILYCL